MIKQSLTNDKILEKKFKILRTSILLGSLKNRDEVIQEFEETAREIDKIKSNVYEELLASKMYATKTLEEEKTRLYELISFIESRVQEKNNFVDDYIKITSNFLSGLNDVSEENNISSYRARLDNITEYFDNCDKIKELNDRLKELRDEIEEKYDSKANNEIVNSKLEDELIEEFNKIITKNEYYAALNYPDIEIELNKIEDSLNEKKNVLDTFTSSFEALTSAGITGAEREEYKSYVQDARIDYYGDIEKKCILTIYKFVLDKENDYDKLYQKRSNIEAVLNYRKNVRIELEITKRDEFEYFVNLCEEQFNVIKSQKYNIENIDKLVSEIADCEDKLNALEEANNRDEIVSLLDEFKEDAPKIEKIELPTEKESADVVEEVKIDGPKPANMVVKIKEPIKINVKTASDMAKLVMKKVVIVLEPKKFNTKRDKLKEAEEELEQEKKIKEVNDLVQKDIEVVTKEPEKNVEIITTDDIEVKPEISEEDNKIEIDFNPETREFSRDFGITLDTQKSLDKSVKETKELADLKINVFDDKDTVFPTEIFIEEQPVDKPKELFSEIDPFLDDNQFEIERHEETAEEILSNMPSIENIGTVKPNSTLSQIQDMAKDSDDIILPTMGLVDNEKASVPIVSENYIN